MSRYDHIFRMLLLGDHNTGKTAVLQTLRRQNLGNFRGRRHSIAVQPVFTMDVEIKRGNRNILVKAMDTGGKTIVSFQSFADTVLVLIKLDKMCG